MPLDYRRAIGRGSNRFMRVLMGEEVAALLACS